MAELSLRCEVCGKVKGFKDMEQVIKKGWVIEKRKNSWDVAYCPKCSKNNIQDKET